MKGSDMSASSVCIVATGHTRFGRLLHDLEAMIVEVTREALAEADLDGDQIDAIFLGHFNSGLVPDAFAAALVAQADSGLRFKPAMRCENACASGSAALHAGINAILAGTAERVLVVGVEKMTSRSTAEVTHALAGAGYQRDPAEAALSFPEVFAVTARAYADRYCDPLPAMARISAKNHENALSNPLAHMHRRLTSEDCATISNGNPLIAPPLRLTDCSLISDGAAAVVLCRADLAKSYQTVTRIRSAVQVNDLMPMSSRDFLSFEGPSRAIRTAYNRAGIGVDDLDFAEVHDCFTIAELLIYEAMGLTEAGRGFEALDNGRVYANGSTPINLSGGLKAKGHPVGATGVSMHALAHRQLTGQAGTMQRKGANLGLVFNMGGAAVANYATILETEKG